MNNNPIFNYLIQGITRNVNPDILLNNIINQNPQMRVVLNQMQQSGMTPKQYVMQYAKQQNINLNPILQDLSNKGIKL